LASVISAEGRTPSPGPDDLEVRFCLSDGRLRRRARGIGLGKLRDWRNESDLGSAIAPVQNESDRRPRLRVSRLAQGQSTMSIAVAAATITDGWPFALEIVAMMPRHAPATSMRRGGVGRQPNRGKIASEGEQQQQFCGQTMHSCFNRKIPTIGASIEQKCGVGQASVKPSRPSGESTECDIRTSSACRHRRW
jgi:hypothetical protein